MNSNELTGSDIDKLANLITEKLSKRPPDDKVVWNAEDCANYLKVSQRQFIDRISKCPNFPDSVPGTSGRWVKAKVVRWAER